MDSLSGEALVQDGTEVLFAWDERALYVAATLRDEDLWAPHTQRDDPLYSREAFEVFLAADGSGADYLELELSAAGVIFDARFPRYRKGETSYDGRFASGILLRGTLNDPEDLDEGWSLELALPWSEICANTRAYCPAMPGAQLRVNVFRLEMNDREQQQGSSLVAIRKPDFHAMSRAAHLHLLP